MFIDCWIITATAVVLSTSFLYSGTVMVASAEIEANNDHKLSSLPGWLAENGSLPSAWHSGFVDISEAMGRDMMSHYIFIESEGNPSTDPIILWSNGGPGASSLWGVLTEIGPFMLNDQSFDSAFDKSGVPTLFYNEYSWTKFANVLMFDWPPPVGFSYCDDPAGDGYSCGDWDDNRMQDASYASLQVWFDVIFPEYKDNELYLTGESYAGIYIPKLAQAILAENSGSRKNDPVNLKGFAVGDACVGLESVCGGMAGPWWRVIFFYGHGQFSNKLFDSILEVCGIEALKSGQGLSEKCHELLSKMYDQIGGFYDYNLYDDCTYENDFRRKLFSTKKLYSPQTKTYYEAESPYYVHRKPEDDNIHKYNNGLRGALNDYVCGGTKALEIWVTQPSVKDALNVPQDSLFFDADNGVGMTYKQTEKNLIPFYLECATKHPDLRVLVYNGDTDPSIDSFVAQNWTAALGLEESENGWRPWALDGCRRMGGYVTRYSGSFDFLTIRGSGHMVPTYKPEATFEFITKWVSNKNWLKYDSLCKAPASKSELSATKKAQLKQITAEISRLQEQAKELIQKE